MHSLAIPTTLCRAILAGLFCSCLLTAAELKEAAKGGKDLLPVRESLIPLFAHFGRDPTFFPAIGRPGTKDVNPYSVKTFPCDRLNPAIGKYLRADLKRTLALPLLQPSPATFLLGLIGTSEDVLWMREYANLRIGRIAAAGVGADFHGAYFAGQLGIFGGIVLMRHPEVGKRFVEEYSSVATWASFGMDRKPNGLFRPGTACGRFLEAAYGYSGSAFVLDVFRSRMDAHVSLGFTKADVRAMEDAGRTAAYLSYSRPRKVARAEQDRAVVQCLAVYGSQIDALMRRVDNPGAPPEVGTVPAAVPAPPSRPEQPTAQHGPEPSDPAALIKEGLAAYLAITDAWRKGEMAKLQGRLLDGVRPLREGEFAELLKAPKEIDRQKQILLDITKLGRIEYQDFDVKLGDRAPWRRPPATVPGRPGRALLPPAVTLRFTIPNSAAILKKHLSGPIAFPDRVRTQDGNLRIYMWKIDSKWHWNPFGW